MKVYGHVQEGNSYPLDQTKRGQSSQGVRNISRLAWEAFQSEGEYSPGGGTAIYGLYGYLPL